MTSHRLLTTGAYLVALLMMTNGLIDTVLAVWPPQFAETSWRYGAAGMLSRNLISVLVGLLLAIGVARFAGHPRALRALGGLCLAMALTLLALGVAFTVDMLRLRDAIQPEALAALDLSSSAALIKMVGTAVAGLVLGLGALGAARSVGLAGAGSKQGKGVVVGRPG